MLPAMKKMIRFVALFKIELSYFLPKDHRLALRAEDVHPPATLSPRAELVVTLVSDPMDVS